VENSVEDKLKINDLISEIFKKENEIKHVTQNFENLKKINFEKDEKLASLEKNLNLQIKNNHLIQNQLVDKNNEISAKIEIISQKEREISGHVEIIDIKDSEISKKSAETALLTKKKFRKREKKWKN